MREFASKGQPVYIQAPPFDSVLLFDGNQKVTMYAALSALQPT